MPKLSEIRQKLEKVEMDREQAQRSMHEIRATFQNYEIDPFDTPGIDPVTLAWLLDMAELDAIERDKSGWGNV